MTNTYKNLEVQFNKLFRHINVGSYKTRERYAKALVNSNEVSLATVQAMLGHSTLDMTRKYIHPDMQEKIKASNAVSNLISNARTGVKLG